ncbi:MAG: endonuclease/exonuclease/phosphatase family protein, partial [Cyanobacteria bacterium]|nr:endonuclease/exonuclease/phosphatase family protein [Cyanobacteriota bacterium]
NLEHFSLTKFRNDYIPEAAMTEYASYALGSSNGTSQKGTLNSILSLQGLASSSKSSDDDIEASIDAYLDSSHEISNDSNREANRLALKAIYEEHVQKVVQSVGKMNRLSAVISDGKAEGKMPDVIAFQEVRNLESVRALLNTSGLNETYQNILFFPPKLGQDGLAIVTSNRVLPHNPNLVETRGTPRPSAEVTLDLGNNKHLVLYNVHFKADKWEYGRMSENLERLRLREAATIGQRIQVKRKFKQGNRFVVVGDFNADHTANMKAFKKSLGLNLVPMAPQLKTHVNGQLDKIYASDDLKVSSPEVVGSLNSNPPQPSDHLMMRFNVTI